MQHNKVSSMTTLLAFSLVACLLTGCDQTPKEEKSTIEAKPIAAANAPMLFSYYFPKNDHTCTALIDFHAQTDLTTNVEKSPEKVQQIVQQMAKDFDNKGKEKCAEAKTLILQAVRIDATDNYGRPDFKNRINILKVTVPMEKIKELISQPLAVETLKQQYGLSF